MAPGLLRLSIIGSECDMDQETWDEIVRVAKDCQRTWGMGFPVISTYLLSKILDGDRISKASIPKHPSQYLAQDEDH